MVAASLSVPVGAAPSSLLQARGDSCQTGSVHRLRTGRLAYAAKAVRPLTARLDSPGRSGVAFGLVNQNGVPTTFGVLSARVDRRCRPTAFRVQLPVWPNGSTGWVRAADVRLAEVRTRIVIDLSQRRVSLLRDGVVISVVAAVVGAPSTPTPVGAYYVNQRLRANNPIAGYGPGAVGISAFSPVLRNWPQGGPIAIHGTDAPALIGTAVSHGCVRIHNRDALAFLRHAVEGTPVQIRR